MDRHIRLLSRVYIAGGLLGGPVGLLMLLKPGFVNRLLLALLSADQVQSVPFATMYLDLASWLILLAAMPAVICGFGLRGYHEWARMLGLILALVAILVFPVGTVAGIYAIWVLLSPESEYLFLEPPLTYRARR